MGISSGLRRTIKFDCFPSLRLSIAKSLFEEWCYVDSCNPNRSHGGGNYAGALETTKINVNYSWKTSEAGLPLLSHLSEETSPTFEILA